jgi:hypothetical protein
MFIFPTLVLVLPEAKEEPSKRPSISITAPFLYAYNSTICHSFNGIALEELPIFAPVSQSSSVLFVASLINALFETPFCTK